MPFRNFRVNDLIWSPSREDEFVAIGSDVYLFRTKNTKSSNEANIIELCNEWNAELVASYQEKVHPKHIAWNPAPETPHLFAIGSFPTQNPASLGIIHLISLGQKIGSGNIPKLEFQREFSCKQSRQCNTLAWNSTFTSLLAAGFERTRSDPSILVWDIQKSSSSAPLYKTDVKTESIINTNVSSSISGDQPMANTRTSMYNISVINGFTTNDSIKAIYETAASDSCHSLNWHPHEPYQLLAQTQGKLKIIDIRYKNPISSVDTKYLHGFSIDPAKNAHSCLAASYTDRTIAIWDVRMFDQPIHQIVESDSILKIQWCPNKTGKLASLVRNASAISIYSIESINTSNSQAVLDDENAPRQLHVEKISRKCSNASNSSVASNATAVSAISTTNSVRTSAFNRSNSAVHSLSGMSTAPSNTGALLGPPNLITDSKSLSNFCWYGHDSNKLLVAIGQHLTKLQTLCLSDIIIISWSGRGDFYWSSKLGYLNMTENLGKEDLDFLSILKQRTKLDYGLKYEIISNINGTASVVHSNSSTLNPYSSTASVGSSLATPLSLTLKPNMLVRSDFAQNIKICSILNTKQQPSLLYDYNQNLKSLWTWFERVNRFYEITIPHTPRNTSIELTSKPNSQPRNLLTDMYWTRYCGLRVLLHDISHKKSSQSECSLQEDLFKALAYYLCGWEIKSGELSSQFYTKLEEDGQFERACCLALLTQNYEKALEILENANKKDSRFGCLWIALSYFYDEKKPRQPSQPHIQTTPSFDRQNSLNQSLSKSQTNFAQGSTSPSATSSTDKELILETCNKLIEQFKNPYLKAVFDFMINKDTAVNKILLDKSLLFSDRIALSVYFMFGQENNKDLLSYFDQLIEEECIYPHSDLHGVLLTGLGPSSIDLFQAFIDQTNDIQTASLAIIHTPYLDVLNSKQVQHWISCYRDELNRFKYWERRAEFDVLKMKLIKSQNMVYSSQQPGQQYHQHQHSVDMTLILDPNLSVSSVSSSSTQTPSARNLSTAGTPSFFAGPVSNNQLVLNRSNSVVGNQHMSATTIGSRSGVYTSRGQLASSSHPHMVHLLCNKCGMNVLTSNTKMANQSEKSLLTIQPSLMGSRSLTIMNSSNLAGTNPNNTNSSSGFFYKLSEQNVSGCMNCAHHFPQCSVCLRLMRVNLNPNPSSSPYANTTQRDGATTTAGPSASSTTQGQQQLLMQMPINRSTSLYFQSPKAVVNPPTTSASQQQMVILRSPKLESGDVSNLPKNLLNEIKTHDHHDNSILNSSHHHQVVDNITFVSTTKYGNWFSWCQSCKHGGHIRHLVEWFRDHQECPFLHCQCTCPTKDYYFY